MRNALHPLASILLRQGVTAHEFAQWADAAFVHAAVELLKEQGTDPSFSRISALTGIQRHAVSDILGGSSGERPGAMAAKGYQQNRLARVLNGWFEDPGFTTEEGRPRVLPLEGVAGSFAALVRSYSGDIYPGIMLEELERVGAVRRNADGSVEALSRRYTTGGASEDALRHAEQLAADILRTIEHNTRAEPGLRLYEDAAIAVDLPADIVPRLSRLLERRAAAFLDDLDGWLAAVTPAPGDMDREAPAVRAGVRVVMVVERHEPDKDTDQAGSG
jgi:hypothetical protein